MELVSGVGSGVEDENSFFSSRSVLLITRQATSFALDFDVMEVDGVTDRNFKIPLISVLDVRAITGVIDLHKHRP